MKGLRVADMRPSQLLHTYGIGSLIDLPHLAVLVSGLGDWERDSMPQIIEDRLLTAVQRRLGPQVTRLVSPPRPTEVDPGAVGFAGSQLSVGVPVVAFPRWLRCPHCDLLSPIDDGVFQFRPNVRSMGESRYVHTSCPKLPAGVKPQPCIPARFLYACDHGHLDDFPWRWFAHKGPTNCRESLRMLETGVTGEAADVLVKCGCGQANTLAAAFEEHAPLPACRGRRPHLRDVDPKPCTSKAVRPILLGATNSWFPLTMTSLYLPATATSEIERKLEAAWEKVGDVEDVAELKRLRRRGELGELATHSDEAIFAAIQVRLRGAREAESSDLKRAEWDMFVSPGTAPSNPDFQLKEEPVPESAVAFLKRVVLVERLREVSALTGFTRIRSPLDLEDEEDGAAVKSAPLIATEARFVPAAEVRGEGIFLQFDEERLEAWMGDAAKLDATMWMAHKSWFEARGIQDARRRYPGLRYVLLHTFSHALMRTLALDCGYSAASIRERIYSAESTQDEPMAGILLYTAAPDAEGTLGGLVEMGRKGNLDRHLRHALTAMKLCSSDPLCASHEPEPDGASLHGAACHACLFAPETSCERGNRYLDRAALVETLHRRGWSMMDPA